MDFVVLPTSPRRGWGTESRCESFKQAQRQGARRDSPGQLVRIVGSVVSHVGGGRGELVDLVWRTSIQIVGRFGGSVVVNLCQGDAGRRRGTPRGRGRGVPYNPGARPGECSSNKLSAQPHALLHDRPDERRQGANRLPVFGLGLRSGELGFCVLNGWLRYLGGSSQASITQSQLVAAAFNSLLAMFTDSSFGMVKIPGNLASAAWCASGAVCTELPCRQPPTGQ